MDHELDILVDRSPGELDILFQDATRFLGGSAHGMHTCIVCGEQHFEMPSIRLNDGKTYVGRAQIGLVGSKVAMSVIPITCGTCGSVREVASHIALEWLEKNPQKEG